MRVRESKSGRPRTVQLDPEGGAFFAGLVADKPSEDPVFEKVGRVNTTRKMRAACLAAGLAPPVVFHDLRRSYGLLLLKAGVSSDEIRKLLGHADLRMTLRAYAHMENATLQRAVLSLPSFIEMADKKAKR